MFKRLGQKYCLVRCSVWASRNGYKEHGDNTALKFVFQNGHQQKKAALKTESIFAPRTANAALKNRSNNIKAALKKQLTRH